MRTRKRHCVECGTYIDSVSLEIYNVPEATRSASSNRDEELVNKELKDTTITKRQLDLCDENDAGTSVAFVRV